MPQSRSTSAARAPEYPLASTFARSSIIARTSRSGSGGPTPAAWLPHEVHLQLAEPLVRDRDVGELAEPGGHAVHDLAPLDDPLDDGASLLHPLARLGRQRDGNTIDGHRPHPVEGERVAVEEYGCGHGTNELGPDPRIKAEGRTGNGSPPDPFPVSPFLVPATCGFS
jgi:hypothetical protein